MINALKKRTATRFVVTIGLVSLFADMTYESARSINGPYLEILGASATTVGWMAGLGELLGYGLRFISGYFSDRTGKYWTITLIGYGINLLSVPLLALAGYWQIAVLLIISERVGKAIRVPPRDAMLSYGTRQMGRGWGYGLHEALDQTGATVGPLLVSAALWYRHGSYTAVYGLLLIPAALALAVLLVARTQYPHPEHLEMGNTALVTRGYPRLFWYYAAVGALIAAGYADYSLIAFHFKRARLLPDDWIPLFYAIAMGSEGLSALILGKVYDRVGIRVMLLTTLASLLFAPLVFGFPPWLAGGFGCALAGIILWGVGMGAQESLLKAAIADVIPPEKRGRAFGLFNTVFGISWFFAAKKKWNFGLYGASYEFFGLPEAAVRRGHQLLDD
ncbi:MAG TPA: MFS transporter [Puia sp.]|nr:MFS transporter [Puia sp.]